VTPLTPQIARQISTRQTTGLIISGVVPASPADHAALVSGYLLTSVNGRAVTTTAEVDALARTLKPGQAVSLMLTRPDDGTSRILNYQVRM
jgi:S1-C subfamily serine protease